MHTEVIFKCGCHTIIIVSWYAQLNMPVVEYLLSYLVADDYIELNPPVILQFSATVTSLPVTINIVDDLVFEPIERFNISLSTTSDGCVISPGNENIPVYILDDGETLCTHTLHILKLPQSIHKMPVLYNNI